MGSPSLQAAVRHINQLALKYGIQDFVPESRVREYEEARAKYEAESDHRRFWAKIIFEDDCNCWRWGACLSPSGYGLASAGGKNILAHRYSYQFYKGPIPAGLVIDHLCRTRHCVNPDHLEAVTQAENTSRGDRHRGSGAKRCGRGHIYTPANTYWETKSRGYPRRACRACNIERKQKSPEVLRERI